MFERWSAVVGGILDVAGITGFLSNLDAFYNGADAESRIWGNFIQAWWDRFGESKAGVAQLVELAESIAPPLDLGTGGERSQRVKLGQQLQQMRDRQFRLEIDGSEQQVRLTESGHLHRAQQWKLACIASTPGRSV
jgi:hypothetical protein